MSDDPAYDPIDPATLLDPYPVYKRIRDQGRPVWNEPLRSWVLASYRDCRAVLSDTENFAADWRRVGDPVAEPSLSVHTIDPPEHTGVYTVLADALRAMVTPDLAERTRARIARMIGDLQSTPVNAITALIEPLARWFIPEAMGLPQFDPAVVGPMAQAIVRAMDGALRPAVRAPGVEAQRALAATIESWVGDLAEGHPVRDLVERAEGAGVPRHVTMNSLRTLIGNAFTGVPSSLGSTLHAVARDETLLKTLHEQPQLLERAPQEFFRVEAAIQGTTRAAVRDMEFAGVSLKRGDGMLVLFAAANRDPEQFDDPDRIRLDRWPNRHLSFGTGAHACIGSVLGHLVVRELLTVLSQRPMSLRITGPVRHAPLATLRVLAELPMEFGS